MSSACANHFAPEAVIAAHTADLLRMAAAAPSADTRLFARLIGASLARSGIGMLGLSEHAFAVLCSRHFPHAEQRHFRSHATSLPIQTIHTHVETSFVDALQALLLEHAAASGCPEDQRCLATIIATACLRPDHLWKDLGLDGRAAVSTMLDRHFPTLAARNTGVMRWKKFLASELALRQGVAPQPAPGCPGCEDFHFCYPEAASAPRQRRPS